MRVAAQVPFFLLPVRQMTNDLVFVDFISALPLEISTQILLALNSAEQEWNSIWQCLVVSKSWRTLILGMPIWKAVQLGNVRYDTDLVCSIIPVLMPKVEELKLGYIPDDIFFRCLACVESGQISSLKSLTLEGLQWTVVFTDTLNSPVASRT